MTAHHPAQLYDEDDIRQLLEAAISEAGTQREFARRIGVSLPFVNDTYRGKRAVTGKVLEALGFERVVLYRPIDASPFQHQSKEDAS